MVSLERLEEITTKPFQRIGLSATQRPLEEVARFLGGSRDGVARPVAIVNAGAISVPGYTTNTVEDHRHILSNSGANNVSITDTNGLVLGTSSVGTGTLTVTVRETAPVALIERRGALTPVDDRGRVLPYDPAQAKKLLAVGDVPAPKDTRPEELAAWTSVCRVVLNLHETITRP